MALRSKLIMEYFFMIKKDPELEKIGAIISALDYIHR